MLASAGACVSVVASTVLATSQGLSDQARNYTTQLLRGIDVYKRRPEMLCNVKAAEVTVDHKENATYNMAHLAQLIKLSGPHNRM